MNPRPLLGLALGVLLAGCASGTASVTTATRTTAPAPAPIPPDLAGHQFDRPDADRVLVAGQDVVLTLPTGTLRVKVNGPALAVRKAFTRTPGVLQQYDATFTVTATALTGTTALGPADFSLLAIADQVDGATRRTTTAAVTTLAAVVLRTGQTVTGTWTAPFVEGHGELLLTPVGAARPAALWDFRAES